MKNQTDTPTFKSVLKAFNDAMSLETIPLSVAVSAAAGDDGSLDTREIIRQEITEEENGLRNEVEDCLSTFQHDKIKRLFHRAPMDLVSAAQQAEKNPQAQRYVENFLRRDEEVKKSIEALGRVHNTYHSTCADGKLRLVAADIISEDKKSFMRVKVDGRKLNRHWAVDCGAEAGRLRNCGTAWGVHKSVKSGKFGSHPYGCGSAQCDHCQARKASARVRRLEPLITECINQDYQVVLVTLTQPPKKTAPNFSRGVVLTEEEAASMKLHPKIVQVRNGHAVAGESLTAGIERLRKALTNLREGQGSREWWNDSVMGTSYGLEWTGRRQAGQYTELRWHVHCHMLAVLRPDIDAGEWTRSLVKRWINLVPNARSVAQDVQVVSGSRDFITYKDGKVTRKKSEASAAEDVTRACRYVLKYAYKPSSLTLAQRVEVLASTKGRRNHYVTGIFHASSKGGRCIKDLRRMFKETPDWEAFEGLAKARLRELENPDLAWLAGSLFKAMIDRESEKHEERCVTLWRKVTDWENCRITTEVYSEEENELFEITPITIGWLRAMQRERVNEWVRTDVEDTPEETEQFEFYTYDSRFLFRERDLKKHRANFWRVLHQVQKWEACEPVMTPNQFKNARPTEIY